MKCPDFNNPAPWSRAREAMANGQFWQRVFEVRDIPWGVTDDDQYAVGIWHGRSCLPVCDSEALRRHCRIMHQAVRFYRESEGITQRLFEFSQAKAPSEKVRICGTGMNCIRAIRDPAFAYLDPQVVMERTAEVLPQPDCDQMELFGPEIKIRLISSQAIQIDWNHSLRPGVLVVQGHGVRLVPVALHSNRGFLLGKWQGLRAEEQTDCRTYEDAVHNIALTCYAEAQAITFGWRKLEADRLTPGEAMKEFNQLAGSLGFSKLTTEQGQTEIGGWSTFNVGKVISLVAQLLLLLGRPQPGQEALGKLIVKLTTQGAAHAQE